MKVFVVWHEGLGFCGAFDSLKRAKDWITSQPEEYNRGFTSIEEVTLNEGR